TRGDGADPSSDLSRDTRPPSSSTLTASGSGPALPAMSASGPWKSDRSVQLPMKVPPTWKPLTTARASSAFFTPTMSSWASLSRVDNCAGMVVGSAHTGGAGAAAGLLDAVDDGGRAVCSPQAATSADAAASTARVREKAIGTCCHGGYSYA